MISLSKYDDIFVQVKHYASIMLVPRMLCSVVPFVCPALDFPFTNLLVEGWCQEGSVIHRVVFDQPQIWLKPMKMKMWHLLLLDNWTVQLIVSLALY